MAIPSPISLGLKSLVFKNQAVFIHGEGHAAEAGAGDASFDVGAPLRFKREDYAEIAAAGAAGLVGDARFRCQRKQALVLGREDRQAAGGAEGPERAGV